MKKFFRKTTSTSDKGFTLVELLVSISLFIVIMTLSMGSIVGVFDANRKSRSLKTVLNNLNLAVESMSKEMRFGKNYHCGSGGTLTVPQNCSSGDTFVSFLSSDNLQISYRINNQTIERRVGLAGEWIAVTAPEIVIDELTFYTLGAGTADTLQPRTLIKIRSHAGSGKSRSDFSLQTVVSQRAFDL